MPDFHAPSHASKSATSDNQAPVAAANRPAPDTICAARSSNASSEEFTCSEGDSVDSMQATLFAGTDSFAAAEHCGEISG